MRNIFGSSSSAPLVQEQLGEAWKIVDLVAANLDNLNLLVETLEPFDTDTLSGSIMSAVALTNYHPTFQEGIDNTVVGKLFSTNESGETKAYRKTEVAPFYVEVFFPATGYQIEAILPENLDALTALNFVGGERAIVDGSIWNAMAGDLSAMVAADPLKGLYRTPDTDPTGVTGAWVRQHDGVLHPHWFGDLDNSVTARAAIQAACDLSSVRGPGIYALVLIPDRKIETSGVIYGESECTIARAGVNSEVFLIKYDNGIPIENTAFQFGVFHPNHLSSNDNHGKQTFLTWHAAGIVLDGATQATIDPAEAGTWKKGDCLSVRSVSYYNTGLGDPDPDATRGEHPHFCTQLVLAEDGNGDTGEIKFRDPVQGSDGAALVGNWTKEQATAGNLSPGRFLGPVRDVKVLGGLKIGSNNPTQWAVGGVSAAINSSFEYEVTGASNGVLAMNGSCFSYYWVEGTGENRGVEIKNHSCKNVVVADATRQATAPSVKDYFQIGERSLRNQVALRGEDLQADPNAIIRLSSCGGNTVIVKDLAARYDSGTFCVANLALRVIPAEDAGVSQDPMEGNTVLVENDLDFGTISRHIQFSDKSADKLMEHQSVRGGARLSSTVLVEAVFFDDNDGGEIKDLSFNDGDVVLTSDAAKNISLDIKGAVRVGALEKFRFVAIDGLVQFAGGVQITTAAATQKLDMANRLQTISFTGETFALQGSERGTAGARVMVTLTNNGSSPVTPTSAALYVLPAGYAWPAIAVGKSIQFTAHQTPGQKIVIMDPTAP